MYREHLKLLLIPELSALILYLRYYISLVTLCIITEIQTSSISFKNLNFTTPHRKPPVNDTIKATVSKDSVPIVE